MNENSPKPKRPDTETDDSIYSNFDHVLCADVEAEVARGGVFARHHAWNFNARVWCDGGRWYSEVWQYGSVVATLEGESACDVIEQANAEYGNG